MEPTIEYRISQSWTIEQKNPDGVMILHGSFPGETHMDALLACIASYEYHKEKLIKEMVDMPLDMIGYTRDRIRSYEVIIEQLGEFSHGHRIKLLTGADPLDHNEDEEEAEFFNQMEALRAEEE